MSVGILRTVLLGTENSSGIVTGVTTGVSVPFKAEGYGIVSVFITGIGTIAAGTVLIEEADWSPSAVPYTGTWSQIYSVSAASLTGGVQIAQHITQSAYGYIRVNISATITGGGTIAATIRAQGGW